MTKEEYIEKAFEESKYFIKNKENFAIISAPGTGKSIILGKIIDNYYPNDNIILLGPSNNIINQFVEKYNYYNGINNNIEIQTYSSIHKLFTKDKNYLKSVKLIICDELHRLGAKTWSKKYEKLVELCPNAIFIGATATPIRQFENRNMVDIYFNGNTVGDLTLAQALKYKFYAPYLTYVGVFHNFNKELAERKKRLEKIKDNKENYNNIMNIINNITVDYNNKNSVKAILIKYLAKFLNNKCIKILIFAKNNKHIEELSTELNSIFEEIFFSRSLTIKSYTCKTGEKNFYNFINANSGVNILYSIDKFSEGIHIPDLDCEIMCRNTESYRVYYQQLGRILSLNGREDPVIIDLVDNFKNLTLSEIKELLIDPSIDTELEDEDIDEDERKYQHPQMYDYVINAIETLNYIDSLIENASGCVYDCGSFNFSGTIEQISKHFGINKIELKDRIILGESIEHIIKFMMEENSITCFGFTGKLKQICKHFKSNYQLVIFRLNRGMSIEEAVKLNNKFFEE